MGGQWEPDLQACVKRVHKCKYRHCIGHDISNRKAQIQSAAAGAVF